MSVAAASGAMSAMAAVAAMELLTRDLGSRRPTVRGREGPSRLRALLPMCAASAGLVHGSLAEAVVLAAAVRGAGSIIEWTTERARRTAVEQAMPSFAASVAAALSAGLRPVDAIELASRHREDPLGAAARRIPARVDAGGTFAEALDRFAAECPGGEVEAFRSALGSGARSGTDMSGAVARLAESARAAALARRRERAARAAPLIQMVVALGLVPSVIALVVAAVLARAPL